MARSPAELPYDEQITDLTRCLETARARVAELEDELDWWQRGRERYGAGRSANGGVKKTELVPSEEAVDTGAKPTLAQAILRIMNSAQPGKSRWTAVDVMTELRQRQWMPNGTSAEHAVRARLAKLARGPKPQLRRVEHGIYELRDSPTAALLPAERP